MTQKSNPSETDPPFKPKDTPPALAPIPPQEIGGRKNGPEPTRYGDWEKDGKCVDF